MNGLTGLERHEGEKLITELHFFGWTIPLRYCFSDAHRLAFSACQSQSEPTTPTISSSLSQGSVTTDDFSDSPSITYRWLRPRPGDLSPPTSWEPEESQSITTRITTLRSAAGLLHSRNAILYIIWIIQLFTQPYLHLRFVKEKASISVAMFYFVSLKR